MNKERKEGQSLIEVLVALAITLLVIVALVRVTISSVRNADFAKKQSQATAYAQEGMENMRAYRDEGWLTFKGAADEANHGLSGTKPSGNCPSTPNVGDGDVFIRCVTLSDDGDNVEAEITVSWTDSGGSHNSTLISTFSQW